MFRITAPATVDSACSEVDVFWPPSILDLEPEPEPERFSANVPSSDFEVGPKRHYIAADLEDPLPLGLA